MQGLLPRCWGVECRFWGLGCVTPNAKTSAGYEYGRCERISGAMYGTVPVIPADFKTV